MSSPVPNVQAVHAISGASPAMPIYAKLGNLASAIDSSGSGTISQSQFNDAFSTLKPPSQFKAAGADAVWAQLKGSETGSVSRADFIQGIAKMSFSLGTAQSPKQTVDQSLVAMGKTGVDVSA